MTAAAGALAVVIPVDALPRAAPASARCHPIRRHRRTNTMKLLDRFQQRDVIRRVVESGLYGRLVGEGRQSVATKRSALLLSLRTATPAEDKRKRATTDAFLKAEAAARVADAAAATASTARHAAWLEMESARGGADKRLGRIADELEKLADPRIEDLRDHLLILDEAARLQCKPELETVRQDGQGRDRRVYLWNQDSIIAVRATLRALSDELQAMKTADYGADCAPRLREILAQAVEVCTPLGIFTDRRSLATYQIEE